MNIDLILLKLKNILFISLMLVANLSLANEVVSPSKFGSIQGDISIMGSKSNLIEEVQNIVIFIEGDNLNSSQAYRESPNNVASPKVTHKGRKFSPHVLPVVRDTKVDFFNDDSIYHNVFSISKTKAFDLGIYPENTSQLIRFEKTGLVKIYCNIHPKMTSNILVLNNDFYTKPNDDGSFIIKNIPLGHYTLRVWHELAEAQQYNIEIKEGDNTLDKLLLTLTKRYIQHKTKFGKNYKSKY
ncbi:MAG: DUF2012 domain-containing protein [Colwellia sp.]|nr:DUF2012 domain-containing protein [Colwellia sp.]